MKTPRPLLKQIEKFLAVKRKSDGGYAHVAEGDEIELDAIIYRLLCAKYEKDPDGDLPFNYILVDRTIYEPIHILHTRYDHKLTTPQEWADELQYRASNADIQQDKLTRFIRIMNYAAAHPPVPRWISYQAEFQAAVESYCAHTES